ncbi:MAG: Rieske 2Fe-2S domain-containing protein, partial [Pseudomonadota bacterium]
PAPAPGVPEGFTRAVRRTELVPGQLREVLVNGRPVAVALVGETVHAVEGTCPHAGGPLAEGILDGTTLTCPMHGWSFDIVTGSCHVNPEDRIGILRVLVVEGVVYVADGVAS